jgi:serine/threonine-protein kinase
VAQRHLDGRSDIYSLAAVLYEMLAGQPPHTGATEQELLANLIAEQPVRLRALRDTVPPRSMLRVARGLAKYPGDRFASGEEFVAALSSPPSGDQLPSALATSDSQMLDRAADRRRNAPGFAPDSRSSSVSCYLLATGGVFAWHRIRLPSVG